MSMPSREYERQAIARSELIERIIREVAELPDRTSPDDEPSLMTVRETELREILESELPPPDVESGI